MEVKINCLLRGESLIHDNVPCSNPIEMCVVSRAVTQSDDGVCVHYNSHWAKVNSYAITTY